MSDRWIGRLLGVGAICCALELPNDAAHADSPPDKLSVRILPKDHTYELARYIADITNPVEVAIEQGQTVEDLLLAACGRVDLDYLRLLENRGFELAQPRPLGLESTFSSATTLKVPYCLKYEVDPRAEGEWAIVKSALKSPRLVFRGSEKSDGSWPGWGSKGWYASKDLAWNFEDAGIGATGQAFNNWESEWGSPVPTAAYEPQPISYWVSLDLKAGQRAETATTGVNARLPARQSDGGEEDDTAEPQSMAAGKEQSDIELLSTYDHSDDRCLPMSMPDHKYPFDSMELLRRIGLIKSLDIEFDPAVELLIADTGLSSYLSDKFYRGLAMHRYGLYQRTEADSAPTSGFPRRAHGSTVVSAALGGAHFLRYMRMMHFPIKIRAINIVGDVNGKVNSHQLAKVLNAAGSGNAIINLSIAKQSEITGLQQILKDERNSLFVAAAGNDSGRVRDKHPATLGGEFSNLIVVAALQQDGAIADRSSYSDDHVELAAPGCRVGVFEDPLDESPPLPVFRSGTSVASPLVAFTAGMLKAVGLKTPAQIKERLLASADYEPRLVDKVKHARALNVVRALTPFHDVVEADEDVEGHRVRVTNVGRIRNRNTYFKFCAGANTLNKSGGLKSFDVVEIEYVDRGERKVRKEIVRSYKNSHKELHSKACPLDGELANKIVSIELEGNGEKKDIKVGDIRKLLFAIPLP